MSSRLSQATQATKRQLKARVALDGPSGAGKTWSALEWATVLAEGGRILVIDTEHGSASLYADSFTFETITWAPPYAPQELADTIRDAAGAGYSVVIIDSLSHFWEGEGGTRDMVDAAAEKAKGNTFAGWKVGTPALRHLIDTMLASPFHLIATMRSKMEYVLETDSRGRQVPKKVGMAPVMRAGVEYEFTLVGDLDLDHRIMVTKSRCSLLADELVQPGRAAEAAEKFLTWLQSGEEALPMAPPVIDLREAKGRLLGACGGDKDLASSLWAGRSAVTADELAELITAAVTAVEQASHPDGAGVADDLAREAESFDESPETRVDLSQLVDGDHEAVPVGEGEHGMPATPAGTVNRTAPLRKDQRRMHALAAKAWPDKRDTDRTRKGAILALTDARTDSSNDLTDTELSDLCDLIQAVIDGYQEVHLGADGMWDIRRATGKRPAKAAS